MSVSSFKPPKDVNESLTLYIIASFWATGLLSIEQFHLICKLLARGRKNMMQSFINHYELFDNAQITWAHIEAMVNEPGQGDLVNRRAPCEELGVIVTIGIFIICVHSCCFHSISMPFS